MLPSILIYLLSSSCTSHDLSLILDAYTCNLLLNILTLENLLFLIPHKQFSFVDVISSSFTITSKKLAEADGPLLFFFQHLSSMCSMLKQKEHLNPQFSIFCPPPHLAHLGLKLVILGHAKMMCSSYLQSWHWTCRSFLNHV